MLAEKLDQITLANLNDLITSQVRESKTLEYKREWPTGADSQLVPVLAGISALANTSGGDFLIGVEADAGMPVAIPGVPLADPDQDKLRLEEWLRNGLDPRLPRCDIHLIPTDGEGNYVVIVRVPQSWNGPHRVKRNDKFYGRNSAGKFSLDVSQLRTAFTLSEQISERIRNFRVARIAAIYGNEGALSLPDYGKLIFHIIPLSAFTEHHTLDITACYNDSRFPFPLGGSPNARFITLDGVVTSTQDNQTAYEYVLVFRTGILESVCTYLPFEGEKVASVDGFEEALINALPNYLRFLTSHDLEPPFYLFVTLIGVKGYRFRSIRLHNSQPIDRNIIQLPEIVLETLDDMQPHTILRPAFDMIWNAFGALKSYNYDDAGNRKRRVW